MYIIDSQLSNMHIICISLCFYYGFSSHVGVLFMIFIGDVSAPRNTHEAEIDQRVSDYLEMGDPDIVLDLREHNHSTSDKYKPFWVQCEAYLQEVTAVHERRHDQVSFLAAAISVRDLIEQVKKRCPHNTPIPSEQCTILAKEPSLKGSQLLPEDYSYKNDGTEEAVSKNTSRQPLRCCCFSLYA